MPAIYFRSFEEGLSLAGALLSFGVAFKLFEASVLLSGAVAALVALVIAYVTFFEFALRDDVVTYRNRFRQISFPLAHVRRLGMGTYWAGLPGHTFMFLMRRPPAEIDGRFFRTGLVSWPSARGWVEAVNADIRRREAIALSP